MSENAYKLGREMVWSNAAGLYMRSFELARRQGAALPRQSRCRESVRPPAA